MGVLGDILDILSEDEEFNPDFTIVNKTGYTICEVYVAPSDEDEWGEDCLDEETVIEDGERCDISFQTNSRKRYWDMRIVDEDDDEFVYEHIDLSQVSKIRLFFDEDGDAAYTCS